MAIANFPTLNFEQTNPVLAGAGYASGLMSDAVQRQLAQMQANRLGIQNQYLAPSLQQQLDAQALKNALSQIELKYADPNAQAGLALNKARVPYMGALTQQALAGAGLTGTQADILRQSAPYMVQKNAGEMYQDPILRRLFEMGLAQKTGTIPQGLLNETGLTSAPQGQQQGQPQQGMPAIPGNPGQALQGNLQQAFGGQGANPITNPALFNGSPMQNWALFGSPLSPLVGKQIEAYGKGLDTQAASGVNLYNSALGGASDSSNDATQMTNLIDEFRNAYKASSFKGAKLGSIPSSGLFSPPFADMSKEQVADNAAQNMQQLVLKLMKTNKLTNYELKFAGGLKLNRAMTPETVDQVGDFLKAKSNRIKEEQPFLTAARDKGIDVQTAQTLWNMYNNQRQVYDFDNHRANNDSLGTWKSYLTNDAVNSVRSGSSFVPDVDKLTKRDLKYLSPQELMYVKSSIGNR